MQLDSREVVLNTRTNIRVSRILPHRKKRTIGAFCFVDYFGPTDQTESMVVASHPHTGLQTVTWLFDGHVEHRDSVGSIQQIKPGQLNLMTAGRGISHSELSKKSSGNLHGIQLWVALTDDYRFQQPSFEHLGEIPVATFDGIQAKVFIGSLGNASSPAQHFSPMLAAQLDAQSGSHEIAVDPGFEHGVLLISGTAKVSGEQLEPGNMFYLSPGATKMQLETSQARLILIGGEPFGEQLVMWWNFIGRNHEEIVEMRNEWNSNTNREGNNQDAFGKFDDDIGGWIPAPDMPSVNLRPRS